jgi:hypothetical protein
MIVKRIVLAVVALGLTACASDPTPQIVNGRYYMMGDAVCARYTPMSSTRIMCHDKNGAQQGYRDAIPNETMQIYLQQQALNSQNMQELNQQIQATNEALARQNEAARARNSQWTPPATPPIGQQQRQTTCLINGNYVACRGN